ncbi:MAG: pirin family protein [Bacteroidetes bacterium]|nr:pirin family protein [Bacteroidota bacterium]
MKLILRNNVDRIHKQDAWKKSAYAFVPYQTNFGELCGFADDVVEAGQGFGMHPHQNMEISTIVISGSQAHKDNTGSEGIINENCVQTMSAGTGIMHSEFNASKTASFHSFQIWVYPKTMDVKPRHGKFSYQAEDKLNKVLLALSPDGRNETAPINQDAFFSVSKLDKGNSVTYKMNLKNNGVYVHCATGSIEIDNRNLETGDAIGIYDADSFLIKSLEDAELIFVEVPMQRGIKL